MSLKINWIIFRKCHSITWSFKLKSRSKRIFSSSNSIDGWLIPSIIFRHCSIWQIKNNDGHLAFSSSCHSHHHHHPLSFSLSLSLSFSFSFSLCVSTHLWNILFCFLSPTHLLDIKIHLNLSNCTLSVKHQQQFWVSQTHALSTFIFLPLES